MGMRGICRAGAAALVLCAAVCASAADRVYLRWTADANALKQASYDSVRIRAAKGNDQRYLDLVCDSGSPAANALPVGRVIAAIDAGAVLQAVIGDVPTTGESECYTLVATDQAGRPMAASAPVAYGDLPEGAISVQTGLGLVTPAREDRKFSPELLEVGFLVNGEDIASGSGTGWTYDGSVLSLTNAMSYVLSGAATNNEVQVHAAVGDATAVLSNAAVFASNRPAFDVAQGATLTVAANQVMMAGEKNPEDLRYATDCGSSWCVLAATGVTVTVKSDIPHVTGFTVSNAVQKIEGTAAAGGTEYRVLPGDDVYVYYTVAEGHFSKAKNPLVYSKIKGNITIDAGTIPVLPHIPYRAWNAERRQMEDKVCTNYTVVTADTATFEDGKWYAVRDSVSRGTITVNGAAHLILCDGAMLETTGGEMLAGVEVEEGSALTIYGQALGTGELVATGGRNAAGIGGGNQVAGGAITIHGGKVTATGGGGLPEGYTAVEYIESTKGGGQYIDTEYTPNSNTMVVCRLLDDGAGAYQDWGAAFGTRTGYYQARGMFLWLRYNGNNKPSYGRAGAEVTLEKSDFPFGDITTVICQGRDCRWFNDAGTKTGGVTLTTGYDVEQEDGFAPMTIFAINSPEEKGGYNPVERWGFRLYSFSIYEGEKLERDFVPCVSASGEAGLYDVAKRKFYGNDGNGKFVPGAVTTANGAGIGGGFDGAGGTVTINGGRVTATDHISGTVTIDGGTVRTKKIGAGDSVTINGGSVKAATIMNAPTNRLNAAVYCVTAKVEKLKVEKLKVEGLGDYGTNDIYAVENGQGENCVYLWLTNGTHRFTVSGGATTNRYLAVVNGGDVAAERLGPIGFFANGTDVGNAGIGDGWIYFGRVLSLTDAMEYLLSGAATNDEVQVNAAVSGATVVLSNAAVFASNRSAFNVAQGATLTVAANQVMRTGATPEALKYTTEWASKNCVIVGPAVTVTVKDIPHVTDVVVSNRTETISRAASEGDAAYRVMAGDDVFVGYTVEPGYTSQMPNPLVYEDIKENKTIDANTIRILQNIPYRAWNGMTRQMEDKECTDYTVVTNETSILADGKWYVVTGKVERGSITVNGAAHLILCDGASLTAASVRQIEAGVAVTNGNALTIYGQSLGTGELVAQNTWGENGYSGACIGGVNGVVGGTVIINGGIITAISQGYGAGIGGGAEASGGDVTINGGRVTASGYNSAGIGGGKGGKGGKVTINGGTVSASHRVQAKDIGQGSGGYYSDAVTINGGSVKADTIQNAPTNRLNAALYRVTAKVEGLSVGKLSVEGLGNYGTNDIYAVKNDNGVDCVYLWLPKGEHFFAISDGEKTYRYYAFVEGRGGTVEPLTLGFTVNGRDVLSGPGEGWSYDERDGKWILTLGDAKTFVLSGVATNNEVQIKVSAWDATVVLSNAVVFAEGRPALEVEQDTKFLMAGGESYLVSTNESAAVSVAADRTLTVRLARNANRLESAVGVFNYGTAVAISGKGTVRVEGGTFCVWADVTGLETANAVVCSAGETMMTGKTPEEMRYAKKSGTEPCILVGPTVTVTVKTDIPHVTGFTVSNAVEALSGRQIGNGMVYDVMQGDDLFVGYTLEAGYVSRAANPLAYPAIADNFTVDADAIPTLLSIPYRAWNATTRQMEDRVCTDYEVVTAGTKTFESNRWYVVRDSVTTTDLTVNGAAHLILCDGAKLTANCGGEHAGIEVHGGCALTIYGQALGTGELEATGGNQCAGIGGGLRAMNGDITVNGGRVTAKSTGFGAGLGGGRYCGEWTGSPTGTITINGGTVTATGGDWGAGIGSGPDGNGGPVVINGGLVTATGGRNGAGIGSGGAGGADYSAGAITINGGTVTATGGHDGAGIGGGLRGAGGTVTITGGQVTAIGESGAGAGIGNGWKGGSGNTWIGGGTVVARSGAYWRGHPFGLSSTVIVGGSVRPMDCNDNPPVTDGTNAPVWRVTVKVEKLKVEKLKVEGLGNYGTNDIYAIDNRVYLWLPKGTHRFSISDGTTTYNYCAVMKGVAITVEPLVPVGFFVNGEDIGSTGAGTGWNYSGKNLMLTAAGPYVLSGEAANDEVHIHVISPNAATVILSNAVVFVSGLLPALNADQNTSLLMAGGTSYLAATNNAPALSVGPSAALTVGLAPGADETESMICVFNYGNPAAVAGAGSVAVNGGTLAVCADNQAASVPLTRTANVFCMVAGNTPETARVVDKYNGEAYVLVTAAVAPVTPGKPVGPFTTAEAASNVMKKAVLAPRDDVEAALGSGAARQTYCNMFGFAVTGGDTDWFVEAVLYPEAWTNVVLSAQAATRQIPVADIAALPTDGKKDVSVTNCVPGFYYTLYGAAGVRALPEGAVYGPELSGVSGEVTFPEVVKPSAAAGFFTIGVKEVPDVTPSDRPHAKLEPPARVGLQE